MKPKRVQEIVIPLRKDAPLEPSVSLGDRLVDALRIMAQSNLRLLVVREGGKPVGMIRIEDTLRRLGVEDLKQEAMSTMVQSDGS